MKILTTLSVALVSTMVIVRSMALAGCGDVTTFADRRQPAASIHVAPSGSDTEGDGSVQTPFATIGHAAALAAPGTAVVVHAGSYSGGIFIYDLAGSADAPIWIGGAAGEDRPVIEGGGEAIHLVGAKYVVIHDLEIRNTDDNGVNCDDGGDYANPEASHHLVFDNLWIHDIGGTGNQDGLKLSGIRDVMVLNSQYARCGGSLSGSGIDMVGCHRGLIACCGFQEMSGNAIQCKGGSTDVEIRWCRIRDGGQRGINIGGSTGFSYFRPPLSTTEANTEARNIRVLSNIIENTSSAFAFVGCVDSVAANNTIVDPTNWIFRILQETTGSGAYDFLPCGNNRLKNNLVYFDRSELSTYVNIGPNTAASTFSFRNNLWYAHDSPSQSEPSLPAPESDGIYGADPLLEDPAAADFRIELESPAAFSGISPPPVPEGIGGKCYGDPPSIGAHAILAAVRGDVDDDCRIDLKDAVLALRIASGDMPDEMRPDYPASGADVNEDNRVGVADALYILRRISGVWQ